MAASGLEVQKCTLGRIHNADEDSGTGSDTAFNFNYDDDVSPSTALGEQFSSTTTVTNTKSVATITSTADPCPKKLHRAAKNKVKQESERNSRIPKEGWSFPCLLCPGNISRRFHRGGLLSHMYVFVLTTCISYII